MSKSKARITIGTGWNPSPLYPADYINRLYAMVDRNTTLPYDFVVYTGPAAAGRLWELEPGIRAVDVGLPYWWCTAPFWRKDPPGIETESILYLDADQVIVGNIDALIDYPSDHCYMKDFPSHDCPPGCERHACGSTSLIRNGAGSRLWDLYVAAGMPTWGPENTDPKRPLCLGFETLRNDPAHGITFDLFPENWIASWKLTVKHQGIPKGCKIVAFHGRPKQHEIRPRPVWIMEHWR